jgi:SAM-dependent methyltransferase
LHELGPRRFVDPVIDVGRLLNSPRGYLRFARDLRRYRRLGGPAPLRDLYPQLHDRLAKSAYDTHYFHQDIWAARHVARFAPERHVDVGSRVDLVGFLTAITRVTFVDIRPLDAELEDFQSIAGSVLAMPFADASVPSLSCLHVAEHIGLGRYGDPLDADGTKKAAAELARILAPGGQLLFSGPVGTPRTCFNAHRIHAPQEIVAMFGDLALTQFGGIDDTGRYEVPRALDDLAGERYACGLFRFTRP